MYQQKQQMHDNWNHGQPSVKQAGREELTIVWMLILSSPLMKKAKEIPNNVKT